MKISIYNTQSAERERERTGYAGWFNKRFFNIQPWKFLSCISCPFSQ